MDLKEFITETISAISDASSELQAKYESDGIVINPPAAQSGNDVFQPNSSNYTMRRVQNISFDVAISASNEDEKGGKGGIKVLSAEIGGSVGSKASSENSSRVSFSIPMTLKPSLEEAKNTDEKARQKAKEDAAIRNLNRPSMV